MTGLDGKGLRGRYMTMMIRETYVNIATAKMTRYSER